MAFKKTSLRNLEAAMSHDMAAHVLKVRIEDFVDLVGDAYGLGRSDAVKKSADLLGVSRVAIYKWIDGKEASIPIQKLMSLLTILGGD